MVTKTITYKDFNGKTRTEEFYFNLTKTELSELEYSKKDGFSKTVQNMVDDEDTPKYIPFVKKLILMAYGIKSEDGRTFRKSKELREEFENSAAFDELLWDMLNKPETYTEFFKRIVPAEWADKIDDSESSQITVNNLPG